MNELQITNEDIELLKEMKENCLKADVYDDEKRLLKANAITKFLNLYNNWNELKKYIEEKIDYLTKIDGQNIPLKDSFEFCSMNELYQTGKYSGLKESLEKMQELEGNNE